MEVEKSTLVAENGMEFQVVNGTAGTISTEDFQNNPQVRELAANLGRYVDDLRAVSQNNTMFSRSSFTPPENPYDEMRAARHAIEYDSVVSGVAETTEAYAFQGIKFESTNPDEADIFNQLAADVNLDQVVREIFREEFTYSQSVVAKLWGETPKYTIRGKTDSGNRKKKTYQFWAPLQLRTLDPCKVVPIGHGPLAGEELAWQATEYEIGSYVSSWDTRGTIDPLMLSFFMNSDNGNGDGPCYQPDTEERAKLAQLGVNTSLLMKMNPEWVFRHCSTKPSYRMFPDIRLKSIFHLLDQKRHLITSDRVALIGAANYIILVTVGDDKKEATVNELNSVTRKFNTLAKVPLIISDHRINIEIISPKQDHVLIGDKYQLLNEQILNRLMGIISTGAKSGGRSETQETLSLSMARVLENRRHMMKRTLEYEFVRSIVRHPKNKGIFETEPSITFVPRNIKLDADGYTQAILALRQNREISRETTLEYFGMDEALEAQRMEIEDKLYDAIFKTEIPYSKGLPNQDVDQNLGKTKDGANTDINSVPASGVPSDGKVKAGPNGTPETPAASGARGGRPVGGGKSTNSPSSTAKPKTANGNPSTGGK